MNTTKGKVVCEPSKQRQLRGNKLVNLHLLYIHMQSEPAPSELMHIIQQVHIIICKTGFKNGFLIYC